MPNLHISFGFPDFSLSRVSRTVVYKKSDPMNMLLDNNNNDYNKIITLYLVRVTSISDDSVFYKMAIPKLI